MDVNSFNMESYKEKRDRLLRDSGIGEMLEQKRAERALAAQQEAQANEQERVENLPPALRGMEETSKTSKAYIAEHGQEAFGDLAWRAAQTSIDKSRETESGWLDVPVTIKEMKEQGTWANAYGKEAWSQTWLQALTDGFATSLGLEKAGFVEDYTQSNFITSDKITSQIAEVSGFVLGIGAQALAFRNPATLMTKGVQLSTAGRGAATALLEGGMMDTTYLLNRQVFGGDLSAKEAGTIAVVGTAASVLLGSPGAVGLRFFGKYGDDVVGGITPTSVTKSVLEDVASVGVDPKGWTPPSYVKWGTKTFDDSRAEGKTILESSLNTINTGRDSIDKLNNTAANMVDMAYKNQKVVAPPAQLAEDSFKYVENLVDDIANKLGAIDSTAVERMLAQIDVLAEKHSNLPPSIFKKLKAQVMETHTKHFDDAGNMHIDVVPRTDLYDQRALARYENYRAGVEQNILEDAPWMLELGVEKLTQRFARKISPLVADDVAETMVKKQDDIYNSITSWQAKRKQIYSDDINSAVAILSDTKIAKNISNADSLAVSASTFYRNLPFIMETIPNLNPMVRKFIEQNIEGVGITMKEWQKEVVNTFGREEPLHMLTPQHIRDKFTEIDNGLRTGKLTPGFYKSLTDKEVGEVVFDTLQVALRDDLDLVYGSGKLGYTLSELEATIPYMSPEAQAGKIMELDNATRAATAEVMSDPALATKVMNETSNPTLRNTLNTYLAMTGDINALNKHRWQQTDSMARQIIHNDAVTEVKQLDEVINKTSIPKGGGDGAPPSTVVQAEQRAGLGTGARNLWVTGKLLYTPENQVRQTLNHAKALGDIPAANAISHALETMDFLAKSHRQMLMSVGQDNKVMDTMFKRWKGFDHNTQLTLLNTIENISAEANTMIRNRGNTKSIMLNEQLEEMIGKKLLGMPENIKQEYTEFRGLLDRQLKEYNDSIRLINEEMGWVGTKQEVAEIPRRAGYIPYLYDGAWVAKIQIKGRSPMNIPIKDDDQLTKALQELYDNKMLNEESIESLIMQPKWGDDYTAGFEALDSVLKDAESWNINLAALLKAGEMGKGVFRKDTIKDVMFDAMKPRKMSLDSLRESVQLGTIRRIRLGQRFKHMALPAYKMKEAASELERMGIPGVAEDMRSYANDVLGLPGETEHRIDKWLSSGFSNLYKNPYSKLALESVGITNNGRVLKNVAGALTFMGRMVTINFNPVTAILQTAILPTNVGVKLGQFNVLRSALNVGKLSTLAKDSTTRLGKLVRKVGLQVTDGRSGKRSAIGMQEQLKLPDIAMSKGQKINESLDYYGTWMLNNTEVLLRTISLDAGIKDGARRAKRIVSGTAKRKSGKLASKQDQLLQDFAQKYGKSVDSDEVIDAYSEHMMWETNFDFDVTGQARLSRNPFFKSTMQFKTYLINELEFLLGMKTTGLTAMERFQSMGMFVAVGGITALPFVDDIDDLYTSLTGVSPKRWAIDNLPDVFLGGIPAFAGVTFTDNVALGGLSSFSIKPGVGGVFLQKLRTAYRRIDSGTYPPAEALARFTSMGSKIMSSWEMASQGYERIGGEQVVQGGYFSAGINLLGLDRMDDWKNKEKHFAFKAEDKKTQSEANTDRETIISALESGNNAKLNKAINEAKDKGYTAERIDGWIKKAKKTPAQRMEDKEKGRE